MENKGVRPPCNEFFCDFVNFTPVRLYLLIFGHPVPSVGASPVKPSFKGRPLNNWLKTRSTAGIARRHTISQEG